MTITESLCANAAEFFLASKQKPRLNCRQIMCPYESEATATIVTADSLRGRKDISVGRRANFPNGLFVHGVEVSDKHDGRDTLDENEVTATDERFALKFFAEPPKKLFLSGT